MRKLGVKLEVRLREDVGELKKIGGTSEKRGGERKYEGVAMLWKQPAQNNNKRTQGKCEQLLVLSNELYIFLFKSTVPG